jgi:hypothetical protein
MSNTPIVSTNIEICKLRLSAANVKDVLLDCMFKKGEDASHYIKASGILHDYGFHPNRLDANKWKVRELLSQLPTSFMCDKGGGASFLDACMTNEDNQWGQHPDIEYLVCLGIALRLVIYCMDRQLWSSMPGGVPYFTVYLDGVPANIPCLDVSNQ